MYQSLRLRSSLLQGPKYLRPSIFSFQPICLPSRRPWSSFKVGDRVLLSWTQSKEQRKKLTKPLRHEDFTNVNNHEIPHDDIIGKPSNVYIENFSKGGGKRIVVRADHPSLDEFVARTPRRVAPVYASYAATIVDQLGFHLPPPNPSNDPATFGGPIFQILEAGTGHGSLTIHLARAVAAANPPPPLEEPLLESVSFRAEKITGEEPEAWTRWRQERRAVIHTVDIDKQNSQHAEKTIRSFRNGLYWPHIDFHTGDIEHWITSRTSQETSSFLDAVILDMPSVHEKLAFVAEVLKPGGQLLIFMPQITLFLQFF